MLPPVTQHITFDKHGRAVIAGTRVRVLQIAEFVKYKNSTAKQIHCWFPDTSLAQIHAALSYYYDNQAAMDEALEAEERESEDLLSRLVDPVQQARLHKLASERGAKKRKVRAKRTL